MRTKSIFVFLGLLLACWPVIAQQGTARSSTLMWYTMRGGIYGGATHSFHSGTILITSDPDGPTFENGEGTNFTVGAILEKSFTRSFTLSMRLGYLDASASLEKLVTDPFRIADDNGVLYDVKRRHMLDYKLRMITFEALAKLTPGRGPGFYVTGGPGVGFVIGDESKYSFQVVEPKWAVSTTIPPETGRIHNLKTVQISLLAAIGYDIDYRYGYITPEIQYSLPLTKTQSSASGDSWRISTLKVALHMTFSFMSR